MSDETSKKISSYQVRAGIAVIAIDSPPVNALSHAVRIAVYDGIKAATDDDAIKATVLICHGSTFFAGADITELGKPILPPILKDIMAIIEASPKPVIAAMHGSALGGGLELALACHYRIALASAKLGLPEAALGLLPGAGGTQRVPRLIGVKAAVEMIVFGKAMTAPAAETIGLIDKVVPENLEQGAIEFASSLVSDNAPLRRIRDLTTDLNIGQAQEFFNGFRTHHPDLFRNLKAPENIIRAIEAAVALPFDDGIRRETELSKELVSSPESAAQRYIFFAERTAAKIPGQAKGAKTPTIKSVWIMDQSEAGKKLVSRLQRAGFVASQHTAAANQDNSPDLIIVPNASELRALADTTISLVAIVNDGQSLCDTAIPAAMGQQTFGLPLAQLLSDNSILEIVRGAETSVQSLSAAVSVVRKLGKIPIITAASHGLIVERLVNRGKKAYTELLQNSISQTQIEQSLYDFGFRPGQFHDQVSQMNNGEQGGEVAPGALKHILLSMAEEGHRILSDQLAYRASDIDVAMVKSGNWPVHTGGPLYWADQNSRGQP